MTDLGRRIDPARDEVRVDGRVVRAEAPLEVVALHKPVGVVSSLRRQGDAPCLVDVLPASDRGKFFHVGRLDRESSGLLLLTNDGALSQAILHPRQPVWKRYVIGTRAVVPDADLDAWRQGGMPMDGRPLAPARVRRAGDPRHLELELREGRNRQIRRMVEAAGTRVQSLHRVAFGPVELGDLRAGELRRLRDDEEAALRAVAGVDDPARGA